MKANVSSNKTIDDTISGGSTRREKTITVGYTGMARFHVIMTARIASASPIRSMLIIIVETPFNRAMELRASNVFARNSIKGGGSTALVRHM